MSVPLGVARSLLCFNLRREHLAGARDAETVRALTNAASVLGSARAQGWRVLHVYTRHSRDPATPRGTIGGLEPFADEPVFTVMGTSAFSEPHLIEAVLAARPARLNLVGAVYSRAGLATVLAAQELGAPLNLLREACFSPGFNAVAPERVLNLVCVDARTTTTVVGDAQARTDENVICLESWRT